MITVHRAVSRSLCQVTKSHRRWSAGGTGFPNDDLLNAAEGAGFDVLLTTDKRIRYQQSLTGRKIAVVVLGNSTWRVVRLYGDRIDLAVNEATAGSYVEVDIPFR